MRKVQGSNCNKKKIIRFEFASIFKNKFKYLLNFQINRQIGRFFKFIETIFELQIISLQFNGIKSVLLLMKCVQIISPV